ncbi:histone deacetylase [Yimella sp. cx-51]|nr:histone deacetylase [Yimella sp. cx-51]
MEGPVHTAVDDELVWYAAYGSNISPQRFGYYLSGGRPPSAARSVPGARDGTAPREMRAMELPGSVFFGWESPTWGGGVAFYDPDVVGRALATAYLITHEQFSDLVAQEMHREIGAELDLARLRRHRTIELGSGRYDRLLVVEEIDETPVVTFTCPAAHHPSLRAPSSAYLETIAKGLRDTHHLADDVIADYLGALRPFRDVAPLS